LSDLSFGLEFFNDEFASGIINVEKLAGRFDWKTIDLDQLN
jgi:hypothetical protein